MMERWPSGLRRTLGKCVYPHRYRGFESHSLRQIFSQKLQFFTRLSKIEKNIKKHQKNLDLKGFLTTQGILDFIKKSKNAINKLS